ncbi:alpha-1-acid glycoprotein 1-like [Ctenodactylus gundi]
MALHWALEALCLLPLLNPQNPVCANLVAMPITSATLDWLSRRWFFMASAFRNPEYKQEAHKIQAEFFTFESNTKEDTVLVQEHLTIGDQCLQNSTVLTVQRANGTLTKLVGSQAHVAHVLLLRDPRSFVLAFALDDKRNHGLCFYTDKPEPTPEQLEEFYQAVQCVGLTKSEILHVNWQKNKCELEKPREQKTQGMEAA